MKTKIQSFKSTPDFFKFYFPNSLPSLKSRLKDNEDLGTELAFDILKNIEIQIKKIKK
jgi:hypothetical protein